MPKESTIQHYSSTVTGNAPAAIDLSTGELAINVADEKVFFKNLGGSVVSLSETKDLSGAFASKSTQNTFTQMQTFSGGLSGNLTGNATTVTVTDTNTGTRFLCMAGGTGQTGIFIDRTTTPLQYSPPIGRITCSSISLTSGGLSTLISGGTINASDYLSAVAQSTIEFVTQSNDPMASSIYFATPFGETVFGDAYGVGSQNSLTIFGGNNIMAFSSQGASIGKLKFGINRHGLGWTGQFGYGIELGQDSSRMMRMTRILDTANDPSTTGPTCNTTFDLDSNGDLTIKPSGGDLIVSGALTVTGTGLSGNVVVNNQLNVLAGATFAASTDVYFGGSTRGIYINGGKGSSDIVAYGNTELNIDGYIGNGTVSLRGFTINMGEIDGNANNTYITVDDSASSINHQASSSHNFNGARINALAGITAATLYVSGGATFDGNTTIGNAATDTTTIYGSKVVNEFVFNNGTARTVGVSWANGNVQLLGGTGSGATGVTAIYFTGAPATGSASITLIVTNGGNMTGNTNFWATNIKWPGGNKPTLTASGTDVISFVTPDAGSTIYGFVGGLNFA
jgi:hypothetical protein